MNHEDLFTGRYERRDNIEEKSAIRTQSQEVKDNGWKWDGGSWSHEDYPYIVERIDEVWAIHKFGLAQRQKGFEDGLEEGVEAARDGAI